MITFKQYFEVYDKIQLERMESGDYGDTVPSKESINRSIERLKRIIKPHSRIGYYPSSGLLIDVFDFSQLPLDYVICSDYDIKNIEKGKVIAIRGDNNLCLRIMYEAGIKLDAVFAIQDGVNEGGNYEFTESYGFIGKLLPLLKKRFVWVSNTKWHATIRFNYFNRIEDIDLEIYRNATYSLWDPKVSNYRICQFNKDNSTSLEIGISETKSIYIHYKSIWEDINKLDAIFYSQYMQDEEMKYFFPHTYKNYQIFNINEITSHANIRPILEFAEKNKLEKIGLTPFVSIQKGDMNEKEIYLKMIKDIKKWKGKYLREINFYHVDFFDYSTFYRYHYKPNRISKILNKMILKKK